MIDLMILADKPSPIYCIQWHHFHRLGYWAVHGAMSFQMCTCRHREAELFLHLIGYWQINENFLMVLFSLQVVVDNASLTVGTSQKIYLRAQITFIAIVTLASPSRLFAPIAHAFAEKD